MTYKIMNIMKKYILTLMAALCLMAACEKEPSTPDTPQAPETVNGITSYGAVDAAFSVSPTKQVRFSMGNLQYKATTATWRFAENQYDRVGDGNENISEFYAGWIDLFGWATSGWDCGNTYYMPYDFYFVDDYEQGEGYGPLPPRDYDLVGEYANCDWGVYNAISNGGNKPGMWRTLTIEEWSYLMGDRANAQNKYAVASIEGINGLVILPDNWVLPEGCTSNPGMGAGDGREYFARKNSYTPEEWLKMQTNGAVFLPAAGVRETLEVNYVNEIGRYWSVTRCFDKPLYEEWCAYTLYFQSDDLLKAEHNNPRDYGRSVRLVQDIN